MVASEASGATGTYGAGGSPDYRCSHPLSSGSALQSAGRQVGAQSLSLTTPSPSSQTDFVLHRKPNQAPGSINAVLAQRHATAREIRERVGHRQVKQAKIGKRKTPKLDEQLT